MLGLCRFWTFCPFRDLSRLQGPLRADRLTGRPLTGRLLTRRPLTNYRKAYGKLRGETLAELGGNFRLCAVDQKRLFFPRAGPFLDLLPFKGPFALTGALTGRQSYGQAPYGEASYGKAPSGDFRAEYFHCGFLADFCVCIFGCVQEVIVDDNDCRCPFRVITLAFG